jgi:hypothetical protein
VQYAFGWIFATIVQMRFIFFSVFVVTLAMLPFFVLNTMVMPELNSMQQLYVHEGEIAGKITQSAQQNK